MPHPSSVQLLHVERHARRPDFTERFHLVTFELRTPESPAAALNVWVSSHVPEHALEGVARALLAARLARLAQAAQLGAYSARELSALR